MSIERLGTSILYENPEPHVRSRHGFFPGLAALPSGDLLGLFVISEAFESADATTHIARSKDRGKSWVLEGALRMKCGGGETDAAAPAARGRLPEPFGPGTSDYLKPSALRDGTVVAVGYQYHREDPDRGIVNAATGGFLAGDDLVAFSRDEGLTWTRPRAIRLNRPELLEISGPCLELASGDLAAVAAPLRMPDGGNPSGKAGIFLRSPDKGMTWSDDEIFFRDPAGKVIPYESRVCEMQAGRLVTLAWAYDAEAGIHLPNHYTVSRDNGRTWSRPETTGHRGQASNLLWLGGDLLLTIHAHRGRRPAIYVRVVDFRGDRWRMIEEAAIYGRGPAAQTRPGQTDAEMFASLRFGQPSLLDLGDGEFLAAHWAVEDGQGKIRAHRLRVRV